MPSAGLFPLPVAAGPEGSPLLIAYTTRAVAEMVWQSRVRSRGAALLLALALPLALIITALALALTAAPPGLEAHSRIPPGHQGLPSAQKKAQAQAIAAPGEEGPLMPATAEDDDASHATRQALLALPLRFVPNAGQTDPSVRFTVQGAGHTFFFTPQEIVFTAVASHPRPDQGLPYRPPDPQRDTGDEADLERPFDLVRLRFLGANPNPHLEGVEPLAGVVNYFLGNDPARWRSNVPTYAALSYQGLYPGVDLVYRGTEGSLKSEFHLAPGADPGAILMGYTGLHSLRLRADGALILETPLGELIEEAPLIYQQVDGQRREVQGRYTILPPLPVGGGGQPGQVQRVTFRVSAYDQGLPLVIDPVLAFSTYLGGEDWDFGSGIAVDEEGNVYVTGDTLSWDFPTHNAIQPNHGGVCDAFVTQIVNADGVYTYGFSTYLGGTNFDVGSGIAVDEAGNVYLTGETDSSDFPTHNAIQPTYGGGDRDAFVSQIINASGVYTYGYSTYLGGNYYDAGYGIAVDGAGNVYLTGHTDSSDFPTHNPVQPSPGGGSWTDAFVTQIISASGVYTYGYSTYLGGNYYDAGYGIAVDEEGNAYVTGDTLSSDFPTHNAIQPTHAGGTDWGDDAFVTQIISASGVYTYGYSTFLGGAGDDWGNGIAVDEEGNAYVTGETPSWNFPTHNAIDTALGGPSDAFVTQIINASGVYTYGYSTFLGGSAWDYGNDIAVDGAGNAYVTGRTSSLNFPTRNAIQPTYGGNRDAFVSQIINASGVYTYGYSTYLGGNYYDAGYGIAVDEEGNAYVVGTTSSDDFPIHKAVQPTYAGGERDAFVAIIGQLPNSTYVPLVLRNYDGP